MHYYQFNIGDFHLHTSHLSLEEEAVYRRLIDHYYDTEKPLPKETESVIRRLRLGSYRAEFDQVLGEFFTLESDGYHNYRCDIEIKAYKDKADKARANGRKGGRPPKNKGLETQSVILANPEETGSKAKHKPLTKNQEPITNNHKPNNNRAPALDYSSWPTQPSEQVLKDWLSHRTSVKAKVSQTVINRLATELTKAQGMGFSADDCLSESMARGWKGFKAEWLANTMPNQPQRAVQREQEVNDWVNSGTGSIFDSQEVAIQGEVVSRG
jgi:uncharacterized protein YdaU (DUF1376 family)